ncbi:MAG: tetratricopeptide repeat protein, partial [Desulfobacterales bacterium]|nr:tetratricopeptide repeat protein [Desulfobacterales bacterium]
EATYGLAREEARLEQIYPYLHHQNNNPYHALPYFEKAIRLRPNSILCHYALARYLHQQKKTESLLRIVSNLARIYPPIYGHLKNEAFWSSPVREAFKKGLHQAIDEEIASQNAHTAMSSLMAGEKNWASAISHYQKALSLQTIDKDSGKYLHLGRLYVKNGQLEEAEESFFKALSMSRTKERHLENLYRVYEREGCFEELYRFYHRVSRSFALSAKMDILLARSLIDLKRYHQAQRILKELNQERPTAEAYYWLARIAEKEKDWDSMELAIQKATVLDPENSRYHLIFSKVLKRLKKLERAEKEAGLALDYSVEPSHWLFDHRAWIRWSKKDYQGAVKDWESAIAVKPKKASFYARAAQAYCKLEEWSQALDHYQKAMDLDPKNENYRKRYVAVHGLKLEIGK